MDQRLKIDEEFRAILSSENVYFQPPESMRMSYPAIRYSRNPGAHKRNANNRLYMSRDLYEGVVIDRDPDSKIPGQILERFPMCNFGTSYKADNLNHFPFTIYYTKED